MSDLNLWDNPLFRLEDRLEIAKGAISFRDKIIKNLREQLKEAKSNIMENKSVEEI